MQLHRRYFFSCGGNQSAEPAAGRVGWLEGVKAIAYGRSPTENRFCPPPRCRAAHRRPHARLFPGRGGRGPSPSPTRLGKHPRQTYLRATRCQPRTPRHAAHQPARTRRLRGAAPLSHGPGYRRKCHHRERKSTTAASAPPPTWPSSFGNRAAVASWRGMCSAPRCTTICSETGSIPRPSILTRTSNSA